MTPKEKAVELVDKFYFYCNNNHKRYAYAEECALIAVDELIKETDFEVPNIRQRFWKEVKQEIEKL